MITYIIRRLVAAMGMIFMISLVTFAIFFLVPRLVGQTPDSLAAQYVGRNPSPEAIAAVKHKLGFDQPFLVQYGRYVKGLVFGSDYNYGPETDHCPAPCLGYSFRNQQPVWPMLLDKLPVTGSLTLGASIIWLIAGVAIGVLSALRRGTLFDRMTMTIALAGVSLPIFFTGLLSQSIFVHTWKVLPLVQYVPFSEDPIRWTQALILPWITLAFLYAALYARLTRAGMLETLSEDYIRTARAKGLRERSVVGRHALRATLTPILTIFGLDVGLLLGGAVLTESTFSLDGIGRLAVYSITANDLPVVMGVTIFAAMFVVVANLVVDILYAAADPRVRLA